jgi:hydantoinase/carbamoylase family amidase
MTGARASVVDRLALLATIGALPSVAGTADLDSPSAPAPAGIARPLFSGAEFEARSLFARWARESNFALAQDLAGNLFARRPGRVDGAAALAPILIGSHLDTVDGGGAYDGAYGVVAALVVLESFEASGRATEHPIEAVAWAGEEGSRFPLGCLGSGAYAGLNALTDIEALVAADGERFSDARSGSSGLLPDVAVREHFPRPAAYLELHIEQGPLLEAVGERLGVVTAIAGARRFRVTLFGERGHAGTLPMPMRRDALCAAAEVVLALEAAAREIGDCVATAGYLSLEPNETNVVPGRAVLRVDMRSVEDTRIDALEQRLRDACARVTRDRGAEITIVPLERRAAVPMDASLRASLHATLAAAGEHAIDVPSGAGHDAMCLASVAPTAMLFVPSVGGRSHVGDEYTAADDLERGAAMLTLAAAAVDRELM